MLLAAMAAKQWGIGIWTGIVSILLAVVYIPFIAHSDTTKKIQSFRAMSWPVIALFFFGISLVALSFHESKLPEENARQQGSRIAGYIEEKTARERGIRLLVRVEDYVNTNGDRAMPFSIFVYTDSADMQVGDKISLPAIIDWYGGNIRRLDDYETAMMRRGVLGSLSTSSQGIRKYHSEDRVIPPPAVMRERISRAIGGAGLSSQSVVLLRMLLSRFSTAISLFRIVSRLCPQWHASGYNCLFIPMDSSSSQSHTSLKSQICCRHISHFRLLLSGGNALEHFAGCYHDVIYADVDAL